MTPEQAEMLIRIDERQQTLLMELERLTGVVEALERKVGQMHQTEADCAATQRERWKQHDMLHADLKLKSYAADAAAFITAATAAVRAFLGP